MPCGGAHDVAADDHAFEQRVRIALDLVAVHVSAGVALVGIADDVFLAGLGLRQKLPFVAGEITGAAASAQLRRLDLLDDVLRPAVDQDFIERLVAADRDVLLDIVGIDEAAIAQDDFLLTLEERDLVPVRDFRITGAVLEVGGDVVPFFDLAEDAGRGSGCRSTRSCRMRSASSACTRLRTISGCPGMRTLTSGSSKQAPKQPTLLPDGCRRRVRSMASANAWYTPSAPLPRPHVPIPMAIRGTGGSKLCQTGFAHCVERTDVLDPRHYSLSSFEGADFALQRSLVHVATDAMVDFDDRRQSALSEARDGADGELAVRGSERELVGLAEFIRCRSSPRSSFRLSADCASRACGRRYRGRCRRCARPAAAD